jgi:hypothetical protein
MSRPVLLTRLDGLLVDLDPSAIMVHGGGMTAVVAAQVAFWRQIPVVHLQAGVATDDLLCPFPQEANRRVIGQLASLFLTTGGAALGSPIGPNSIPVGDTMSANPEPADLRFAGLVRRVANPRDAARRRGPGPARLARRPGEPARLLDREPTSRSWCSAARRARCRAPARAADGPSSSARFRRPSCSG